MILYTVLNVFHGFPQGPRAPQTLYESFQAGVVPISAHSVGTVTGASSVFTGDVIAQVPTFLRKTLAVLVTIRHIPPIPEPELGCIMPRSCRVGRAGRAIAEH